MNIEKTEYIIKSLTKGCNKIYETYVINGIYHKLNNPELEIVTQKYVKNKKDNNYYLIDLYLPQFKIGIEVNERYHEKRMNEDEYRKKRIITLSEVEEIFNICITENNKNKTLDEINEEIEKICLKIKSFDQYKKIHWLYGEEKIKAIKDKGKISIGDEFRTNVEIINLVFNTNYKNCRRAGMKRDNVFLWFPIIDTFYDNDKELSIKNHWKNSITDDYSIIYEQPDERYIDKKINESQNDKINQAKRYVFLKERDSFGTSIKKFIGLYESYGWNEIKKAEEWRKVKEVDFLKLTH